MDENKEIAHRLNEILSRFWPEETYHPFVPDELPFPITSPAEHATKAEFTAEKKAVEEARKCLQGLMDFLSFGGQGQSLPREHLTRLHKFLDDKAQRQMQKRPSQPRHVVRNAAIDVGVSGCAISILAELDRGLRMREQELNKQEDAFWSQNHRARNHHAYAIALSLARHIKLLTGKDPTLGTASDGGHPSTDFGRALEEVFDLLGIKSGLRGPGEWAVKQVGGDDRRDLIDLLVADPSDLEDDFVDQRSSKKKAVKR